MNKIIKQELIKASIKFNDTDNHIIINKVDTIDPKFTKENQCYIIEYDNNKYKVEALNKNDEGVLFNGILFKDDTDVFLETLYKRLSYDKFKIISKI